MKKVILITLCSIGFFITSCDNKQNKADEKSNISTTDEKYQCPMKCEGEKTYAQQGECPVCHMELKEVKD